MFRSASENPTVSDGVVATGSRKMEKATVVLRPSDLVALGIEPAYIARAIMLSEHRAAMALRAANGATVSSPDNWKATVN